MCDRNTPLFFHNKFTYYEKFHLVELILKSKDITKTHVHCDKNNSKQYQFTNMCDRKPLHKFTK